MHIRGDLAALIGAQSRGSWILAVIMTSTWPALTFHRARSVGSATAAFRPPGTSRGGVRGGAQRGRRAEDRLGDQDPEVV